MLRIYAEALDRLRVRLNAYPIIIIIIITARQQSAVLPMIDSVWPSIWPPDCHTLVSCQNDSSYDHAVFTLVSWQLTSARNSKVNIGSEGAKWERGSKNRQLLANKSPYLRNGAR